MDHVVQHALRHTNINHVLQHTTKHWPRIKTDYGGTQSKQTTGHESNAPERHTIKTDLATNQNAPQRHTIKSDYWPRIKTDHGGTQTLTMFYSTQHSSFSPALRLKY
jgi:hypothetical protein